MNHINQFFFTMYILIDKYDDLCYVLFIVIHII